MDQLSIQPALVPLRPDQRVEQDLAILVQDPDLDEIVEQSDPRAKPGGL